MEGLHPAADAEEGEERLAGRRSHSIYRLPRSGVPPLLSYGFRGVRLPREERLEATFDYSAESLIIRLATLQVLDRSPAIP